MAVGDAYGAKQWREGEEGSDDEVAYRTERISALGLPGRSPSTLPHRGDDRRRRSTAGPKWTV